MGSIGFAIVVRSPTGRRANAGPRVRRTIINLTSPRLSSTFHSQKGPPPPPPQPARWRTFRYDRAAAAVTVRPALVSIPRGQISRTPPALPRCLHVCFRGRSSRLPLPSLKTISANAGEPNAPQWLGGFSGAGSGVGDAKATAQAVRFRTQNLPATEKGHPRQKDAPAATRDAKAVSVSDLTLENFVSKKQQMVANSALAGDPVDPRWGERKPLGNNGWVEKKTRWREDEREGVKAYGGGGWNRDTRIGAGRGNGPNLGGFPTPNANQIGNSALLGDHAEGHVQNPGAQHGWSGEHGNGNHGHPLNPHASHNLHAPPLGRPGGKGNAAGEPARPSGGRGFVMGRGRGMGGQHFGGPPMLGGAGVPQMGNHFGLGGIPLAGGVPIPSGFHTQGMGTPRTGLSAGVPHPTPPPAEPIKRHGPVRFAYSHSELRDVRARGGSFPLPHNVDPDSVPLVTVKPGDATWELTVEGARGGAATRMAREWAHPNAAAGIGGSTLPVPKNGATPEWAASSQESVGSFHLGGPVPALTAEEQARFMPAAETNWLTGGAGDAGLEGALESESENTNRGGGVTGDPDVDDNDGTEIHRVDTNSLSQAAGLGEQQETSGNTNLYGQTVTSSHETPWIYKDPSGVCQGPFPKHDLMEWHTSGYFPLDLPLRPADAPPDMPFVPLAEMLECGWRYPGPRVETAEAMRAESAARSTTRTADAEAAAARTSRERRDAADAEARQVLESVQRAEAKRLVREEMRERKMHEQQMQRQQAQQQQQQQGTGWHDAAPPTLRAPPRSLADLEGAEYGGHVSSSQSNQPNLLANLFGGGGGTTAAHGAPPPPPPGGGMSLADLERSMGGMRDSLPPSAPRAGSFDTHSAWGGDTSVSARDNQGWTSAPAPGAHGVQQMQMTEIHVQQMQMQSHEPAAPPSFPAWGGNSGGGGQATLKSLAEIQREEEQRAAQRRRDLDAAAAANPHAFAGGGLATAWGGANASAGPSLAQIQAEELRQSVVRAAAQQQQQQQERSSVSQHTARSGSGTGPASGAWAGGTSAAMRAAPPGQNNQNANPQGPGPSPAQSSVAGSGGGGNFWDSLPGGTEEVPKESSVSRQHPAAAGGGWGQPAPAQPASPSPTMNFKAFCRAEMRVLNDSDDLTLVEFLLSLPSAGEVTEYVQLYLGGTARAAAFGNELIRAKRANPNASAVDDFVSPGELNNPESVGEFSKPKRRGKK